MIAQTGSATRAATALHTTQPSITRTIRAFEQQCGFALFDRGRYGMALTAAGRQLLESVDYHFNGLISIERTIGDLREGQEGMLHTIAIPTVAEGALAGLIARFVCEHPRIAVSIDAGRPEVVMSQIVSGMIDFGAVIGAPPQGFDLETFPIGQRTMMLAVPSAHRLANRETVHFRELHGEVFALIGAHHNIRLAVDAMMTEFGVRPRMIHDMGTQRTAIELVRHGIAIAFADTELVESIAGDTVVAVRIEPTISWDINLLYRRDRAQSDACRAFLNWLRDQNIE